jgi:hypothetical protein
VVGQKDKAITLEWLSKLEVANAIIIFHFATVKYGEEKKMHKNGTLMFCDHRALYILFYV